TNDESKNDEAVKESEEDVEEDSDEQATKEDTNEEDKADDENDKATEDKEAEDEAADDEDKEANEEKDEAKATKPAPRMALFSQSRAAAKPVESKTSRLGHIRGGTRYIYKTLGNESSKFSSVPYQDAVYYIKKQAKYNGKTYYLLSTRPSSTTGIVGWMQSTDISSHKHVAINKEQKVFTIKGTGKSYTKAWGGNKNLVYNLFKNKGKEY